MSESVVVVGQSQRRAKCISGVAVFIVVFVLAVACEHGLLPYALPDNERLGLCRIARSVHTVRLSEVFILIGFLERLTAGRDQAVQSRITISDCVRARYADAVRKLSCRHRSRIRTVEHDIAWERCITEVPRHRRKAETEFRNPVDPATRLGIDDPEPVPHLVIGDLRVSPG